MGVFATLYAAMPNDFFFNQSEYNVIYQEAAEIEEEFDALNLVTYNSFGNDTMSLGYTSVEDAEDAPQWETALSGRFLEVWWGTEEYPGFGSFEAFEVRDTEERDFLGYKYYARLESANLIVDGTEYPLFFTRTNLEYSGYEDSYNMTIAIRSTYLSANIILRGNGSQTLGDSWDSGVMDYSITYEIDFDAMKPSAFLLIGQMLTFQSPEWGIPGLFGEILSYVIGLGFWATMILLFYTIITKLIPTIQGGLEN